MAQKSSQHEKRTRQRQAAAARRSVARRNIVVKVIALIGVLVLVLGLVSTLILSMGSTNTASSTTTTSSPNSSTLCPEADGSSPRQISFTAGFGECIDFTKQYNATFDTTEGTVVVSLDMAKTPQTVNNFVSLARFHYYDNTNFFRTDASIDIIQGGSPHSQSASDEGPGYTIRDEGTGFTYAPGDLVMARQSSENSGSAQFFFVAGPKAAALDAQGTYVVFGHTTAGLDVLQTIMGLNVKIPKAASVVRRVGPLLSKKSQLARPK